MDTLNTIIQLASTLGLGALIGILIKNALDRNREQNARLFEARREAYRNVIGRINNLFLEEDARGLNRIERKIRMNTFFSDASLLGSDELNEKIDEYIDLTDKLDAVVERYGSNDGRVPAIHSELSQVIEAIESLMRKELGVK